MIFSFRVKLALLFAAGMLTLVFVVFAVGSYYINTLQKRNVKEAEKLAREQVRELSDKIGLLLANDETHDLSSKRVKEEIGAMTKMIFKSNDMIVASIIVDAEGNQIVEQIHGQDQVIQHHPADGAPHTVELPGANGGRVEASIATSRRYREIKEPIRMDGLKSGEVRLRLTDTPTFQRIQTTSREISVFLFSGVILLLAFLLFMFYSLYRLFMRQVDLLQRNARLDRMAYVGTLASGLAHEIRNPLSAMNVNLEVMKEEITQPNEDSTERAVSLAGRLQNEVTRLNSTLTSFLDFALPTKEGFTDFSLRCLVEELLEYHAEQMKQAGITWELQAPPSQETMISADRRLIHQAYRNIFLNAVQVLSGSVKRHIRIKLEMMPGDRVRSVISDTGPGVSPENLSKIFEVFFSTRKGGSGFGLAITKKIIEEHGGTIRAENNPDSLGASFIIELPREARDPAAAQNGRVSFSRRERRSLT